MNTGSDGVLTVERPDEATAVLTLNRPQRRNALTIEMMESLCQALDGFASQRQPRVVILRGAGPAFCSGLDLDEAAQAELAERSALCVARAFQTVADLPLVTIAAVHGAAYAGGAGLMACCDFIVAADDLRVCFPEVRRGLVPALVAAALHSRSATAIFANCSCWPSRSMPSGHCAWGWSIEWSRAINSWRQQGRLPPRSSKAAPVRSNKRNACCGILDTADRQQLFARALEFHKTGPAKRGSA